MTLNYFYNSNHKEVMHTAQYAVLFSKFYGFYWIVRLRMYKCSHQEARCSANGIPLVPDYVMRVILLSISV